MFVFSQHSKKHLADLLVVAFPYLSLNVLDPSIALCLGCLLSSPCFMHLRFYLPSLCSISLNHLMVIIFELLN